MKANVYVEFQGKTVSLKDMHDRARDVWKDKGNKVKDLETLDVYVKPDEHRCYYVFNDGVETGSFEI